MDFSMGKISQHEGFPGPLPLGVAVIDSSITLFGLIFPRVANKHRLQILEHFMECIRHSKSSRADAVTMNIFAALLSALKCLTDVKGIIGQDDVRKSSMSFIIGMLTNSNPILRCAAAESLGRLAQVVSDPRFTAELAQSSFDKLKSAPDIASRTGHSLVLGYIHKYVGGMGSSQHLNTSVSILLALAQDITFPEIQVWSLFALSLMAESAGPMFRGYVEPSLSLMLKLLLTVSTSNVGVHHCIGKVLSALITVVGPEFQGNSAEICTARCSFLCACSIMQDHQDPLVQAEATACLQQLHLFTPRYVNLSSFVPTLCKSLSSDHLLLRKAAISCLRQLAQREAREVCEHALTLIQSGNESEDGLMTETGLPNVLFKMLDTETDNMIIKDIHDTLTSMLQILAADNLTHWLTLCRSVLTVSADNEVETAANGENAEEPEEESDDLANFKSKDDKVKKKTIQPRWPTRVFAAECIRKIIATCLSSSPAHFNLQLAKEIHLTNNNGDFLVLHLSELIRMAFIAATSNSDELRLEGLQTLHYIIEKFCKVPEPEFPGHLLLEQFQAQVGAALRPAFSSETASNVTAAACAVCSAWIGSGVAKDLNDLRRVHQLLVSSLTKLRNTSNATTLYNESIATLEKLSILKAWAEVYIVAMVNEGQAISSYQVTPKIESDEDFGNFESKGESLLTLVQPELATLAEHWLSALRDHALLMLPPEYASQLPRDGGSFYTNDTMQSCKPHYCATWPALLHASTLWLSLNIFKHDPSDDDVKLLKKGAEYFGLIFGICMEALFNSRSTPSAGDIITCLRTLHALLVLPYPRQMLTANSKLPVEVCNVMHRLILTQDQSEIQKLCMDVLKLTIVSVQEQLNKLKKSKFKELYPANQDMSLNSIVELDLLGEGGEDGDISHGKGFVFSVLEVCLCLIVRQIPNLNPSSGLSTVQVKRPLSENEQSDMVSYAITTLEILPDLCSSAGAVSILPTVLYLITSVLIEMSNEKNCKTISNSAVTASLNALKILVSHKYCSNPSSSEQWNSLLQSTMSKLIDLAKTGSDETRMNDVCMMSALAVFVLNAPLEVVIVPNLQYPCINYFRQCFQNENIQIRIKCVQTLKKIFAHPDKAISNGYILALAPRLVEYLHTKSTNIPETELELQLVIEITNCVETLIELADPGKGIKVLDMLVPALINFLLDDSYKEMTKHKKSLHDFSLHWLTKIGPQYPLEFKTVVAQNGTMRAKLEAAIRARAQKCRAEPKLPLIRASVNSVPTIRLKTDFTNFQS